MNTFTDITNKFDIFLRNGADRLITFKIAMNYYLQHGGKIIVETGTQRQRDDWSAGCSTTVLGKFISEYTAESKLFSVDITPHNVMTSKFLCEEYQNYIEWFTEDSVGFLKNFDQKIDFLYLDSYDWFPHEPQLTECQTHQLNEMLAAVDKMSEKSVILLDDNDLPDGGKTRITKNYLAENNWICLFDAKQSVWIRK